MSYTQIIYHLVFGTKRRLKAIPRILEQDLYAYISGVIHHKNSIIYRISGMEDHLHISMSLSPQISLADMVRDIKTSSSLWMRKDRCFSYFDGWGRGYAAFTYNYRNKDILDAYIDNQKEHHKAVSFEDEVKALLIEHGCSYNEGYLDL